MTTIVHAADDPEKKALLRAELDHRMAVTPAMLHSIDENGLLISVSDAWLANPRRANMRSTRCCPSSFAPGAPTTFSIRWFARGRVIDVLISAVLENNPAGEGRASLAVITDITALKKIERLLAESEARYRFIAEHSADMILLTGHDGQRHYASPACRALLGYEPEEMLEIRAQDAIHPNEARKVLEALATGTMDAPLPFRMRRKDGSYVWVEAVGCKVDIAGQSH
jgi:PAS domain S-box-containing protein